MRIVAISGSLDSASSNTTLIRGLSSIGAPDQVAVWEGVGDLPHFRPDGEATDPVQGLRRAVASADVAAQTRTVLDRIRDAHARHASEAAAGSH